MNKCPERRQKHETKKKYKNKRPKNKLQCSTQRKKQKTNLFRMQNNEKNIIMNKKKTKYTCSEHRQT